MHLAALPDADDLYSSIETWLQSMAFPAMPKV